MVYLGVYIGFVSLSFNISVIFATFVFEVLLCTFVCTEANMHFAHS